MGLDGRPLQSIRSTMNELYPLVEQVLKDYSEEALLQLLETVAANPGEKTAAFDCPANYEYLLRRFITACLARDPNIKFNAHLVLSLIAKQLASQNSPALLQYALAQANHKKHCGGKSIEIQAFVIGKILILRSLRSLIVPTPELIAHLVELNKEFEEFEEQLVELAWQLSTDKKTQAAFSKLQPTTKAGFVLFSLFQSKIKKTPFLLTEALVDDVLAVSAVSYPKQSICLGYLGPLLKSSITSPAAFLEERLKKAFGGEEEEFNVKMLFGVLQLLEGHLKDAQINASNVWQMVSVPLLNGWLLQLKVKNKHVRRLAESITIDFAADPALALAVLTRLHQENLYLDNINSKHPLFQLYQLVEPHQFATYLLQLCQQQSEGEGEDKVKSQPVNELEFFVALRHKELTVEENASIVSFFVNRYQSNREEPRLQALNTVLNSLLSNTAKKHTLLNARPALILAKVDFGSLELGQNVAEIKQAAKEIRTKAKEAKEEKDQFNAIWINFLLAYSYYTLIYPEEIELYGELQMVEKDLRSNILLKEEGLAPKKKRKANEQDKKKPIHVLIDIFISLLTKSPQFLRIAVSTLFEQLIGFYDSEDMSHLLEVILKSDHQYIEDTQQS